METRKIHYKSDFDCILRLKDCRGEEVGWPGFDWEARFWTWNKSNMFVASRRGDVLTNCFEDNGRIHVVFDNHRLGSGNLRVEFHSEFPDGMYPDGIHDVHDTYILGIELVNGAAHCPSAIEAELMLPYILADVAKVGKLKALPFVFAPVEWTNDYAPGVTIYDRKSRLFYRDGEPVPPEENSYNVRGGDGTPKPSTVREFVCGNVVYRHTSRELVNVAIERNPNLRLVNRTPSLDAHPGLAYLDCGFIRVGRPRKSGRVSLAGMSFQNYCTETPLSSLEVTYSTYDIEVTPEREELSWNITDPQKLGWIRLLLPEPANPHESPHSAARIGVRYDNSGRKVFYRFRQASLSVPTLPAPSLEDALSALKTSQIVNGRKMRLWATGKDIKVQIWRRSYRHRHTMRGDEEETDIVRQWRWMNLKTDCDRVIWGCCLVRMRRVGKNAKSEWAYFHVAPNGDIWKSRQRRT